MISPRHEECQVLQVKFFSQAKFHLDIECGKASIPAVQALLLLFQTEASRGRDRMGRVYYYQAMDMYRRLGFAGPQSRPAGSNESDDIQQGWRAKTTIIWGIFCVDRFALPHFIYSKTVIDTLLRSAALIYNPAFTA